MPKLVQKSGYVKASRAGGYMKYIATRAGVEKPESNDQQDPEVYMRYIATRPGAERHGSHGLFSSAESVDLGAAMRELSEHEGNVWTIIYSLRREDAARLGFDNAAAWRDLLMAHQPDLADAMKIPAGQLRWYAAFHDLGKLYLDGQDVPRDTEAAQYWLGRSADQGNQYARFLLEQSQAHPDLLPTVLLSATRLLHHMSGIFQQNSAPSAGPVGLWVDSKLRQRIREKKIAMGHRPDDHEEYQEPTMSM